MTISATADLVYRDYTVDGDPTSGAHKPIKSEIRNLFEDIGGQLNVAFFYGAAGDGITDDSAAIQAALESGAPMDGQGFTYAIASQITVTEGAGKLCNANFVLSAFGAGIKFSGIDDVDITGCTFDAGGFGTQGDTTNNILEISSCDNVLISHNHIYNGGPCTGIKALECDRVKIVYNTVENLIADKTPEPADDVMHGIYTQACTDAIVAFNTVRNLKCYVTPTGGPNSGVRGLYVKYGRGFVFGGTDAGVSNDTITVIGNISAATDQAFDFTGTFGSANVLFMANVAKDSGTYDFKFTGASRHIQCVNNHSIRAGKEGIILSGDNNVAGPTNGNTTYDIIGNLIEDTGADGLWSDGTWASGGIRGIHIAPPGAVSAPRDVRIALNRISDTTGHLLQGIISETATVGAPTDNNILLNELLGNGNIVTGAAVDYVGFQEMACELYSGGNKSVTTAAWASFDLSGETRDTAHIHDVAVSNPIVHIKRSGWWHFTAAVTWPANGTGVRKIRLLKTGAALDNIISSSVPHATEETTSTLSASIYLVRGDTVSCQIWQNSGGTLTVDRATQRFTAEYRGF